MSLVDDFFKIAAVVALDAGAVIADRWVAAGAEPAVGGAVMRGSSMPGGITGLGSRACAV
jgi:hypothetical protein